MAIPVDHKLNRVYRFGGGLTGIVLLTFGSLGFLNQLDYFSTSGERVAGLSSNGLLSTISLVVGSVLIVGAILGGNIASLLNTAVGTAFLLSGLANLAVMETRLNLLAFDMPNVIFSFVVGLMVLTFGLYGRVSGALPTDNPYWRARHGLDPEGRDGDPVSPRRMALLGAEQDAPRGADQDSALPGTGDEDGARPRS